MNNSFKILKYRHDNRIEKNVKGYLEGINILQNDIDQSLFHRPKNY